jgi:hypothetical protein
MGGGECDQAQFCPDKLSLLDGLSGRLLATTVLPGPQPGNPTPIRACGIGVDVALDRALITRTPEGRAAPSAVIVDPHSGKVLATPRLYFGGCAVQVDEQNGRAFVLTASNDYAPQAWATLTVVDLQSGTPAGSMAPGGQFTALSLDDRIQRILLLGTDASNIATIRVVDARTGALLRSMPLGTAPWNPPANAPSAALAIDTWTEHLFAAFPAHGMHTKATLLMLDATISAPPATVIVGIQPSAVAVDGTTHRAFVLDWGSSMPRDPTAAPGDVSVVDTIRGAVLRHVLVGPDPQAVAVDERAGRVLVVNTGRESGNAGGAPPIPSSVSILDAQSGALIRTVRSPYPLLPPLVVDEQDDLAVL